MSMLTRKEIWSLEFHAVILFFSFVDVQNKDIYILLKKASRWAHKSQSGDGESITCLDAYFNCFGRELMV